MHKHLFFFIVALIFAATACESLEPETDTTIAAELQNTVSVNDAMQIAKTFLKGETSLSTRGEDISVSDSFDIEGKDGSPLLHVFNFEGGGFVIVAGDNRFEPILAYSEENHFDHLPLGYPDGLEIWIEDLKDKQMYMNENALSQDKKTYLLWNKYYNPLSTRSLTPEEGIDPECDTMIGPLVSDSWHQYSPYNGDLGITWLSVIFYNKDTSYVDYEALTPVIGGVPLSIARIMHFWSYPTGYSWNSMSDSSADSYNKSLLYDVHNDVRSYATSLGYSFNYFASTYIGSGQYDQATNVNINFPIDQYLTSRQGFASASTISYSLSDYYKIRREIFDYSRPVILTGRYSTSYFRPHHTWICDGYHYKFEHWYDADMNPIGVVTNRLHHIWGLSGSCDGWFSFSDMDIYGNGNAYKKNMKLTYHIKPY